MPIPPDPQPWARWVRDRRKAAKLARNELARLAQVDPSYITLIERDGNIPSRTIVTRLGMALGRATEALVVAGYVPYEQRRAVACFLLEAAPSRLPSDIAQVVRDLAQAPANIRQQAAAVISALLSETPPKRRRA